MDIDMDSLTEEELRLAIKIGLVPEKKKKIKPKTEYGLQYKVVCKLCGSQSLQHFLMLGDDDCVTSIPIERDGYDQIQKKKVETADVVICLYCKEYLSTKSRCDLIDMILDARRNWLRGVPPC